MTDLLRADDNGIRRAGALLQAGRLVAMPTETVYGLAARFDDAAAVQAVFDAKQRPAHDPLIVHISPSLVGRDVVEGLVDLGLVDPLAPAQAQAVRSLAAAFWPGPLTLVLPRGPRVSDAVTSGLAEVAVRMPAHRDAQALLDAARHPLVAPSANRFGRLSPTTAQAVLDELDGRIDAVLDGGPCPVGVESTVLRVRADGSTERLRPGAVSDRDIAGCLGAPPEAPPPRGDAPSPSPGQLPSHYAPATPVFVGEAGAIPEGLHRVATLAWQDADWWASQVAAEGPRVLASAALSEQGDPAVAARALFSTLRTLDEAHADCIVVEPPPEGDGLLDALRDRLARAAAPRG